MPENHMKTHGGIECQQEMGTNVDVCLRMLAVQALICVRIVTLIISSQLLYASRY